MPELIGLRFGRTSLDGEKYDPNVRPAIMQSPDAVLARRGVSRPVRRRGIAVELVNLGASHEDAG